MDYGVAILTAVAPRVEDAVRGLLAAVRAHWRASWPGDQAAPDPSSAADRFRVELRRELDYAGLRSPYFEKTLEEALISHVGGPERLSARITQSHAFIQATLGDLCPHSDLRYFAMRELRRRFDLSLSSESAALIRTITQAANSVPRQADGRCRIVDLVTWLNKVLQHSPPAHREGWQNLPEFLLEFLGALDLARPTEDRAVIQFLQPQLSPDALLSHLFGVPTALEGLDALVGGGGLMLVDVCDPPQRKRSQISAAVLREHIGGRTVLTVGQFGSGKSLLTLQFAMEVARKGGVVWIMALEQSVEECLFSIESLGISVNDQPFPILTDLPAAVTALREKRPSKGAIVFLRISDPTERSYSDFLKLASEKLSWMQNYPLRLLVIDPINGLFRDQHLKLRTETIKFFHTAKQMQVNLWICCERQEGEPIQEHFEENIADTVLHLGIRSRHQHRQRFVEVTKSRLQKEEPGEHAFEIRSGKGIRIFPNSASVSASATKSECPASEGSINLGIRSLCELVGEDGVRGGDLITYYGPTGASKTLCGVHFLVQPRSNGLTGRSLFVADFPRDWMEKSISTAARSGREKAGGLAVDYYAIAPGYVAAGEILERLADMLAGAHRRGTPYERVLLSNVTRWLMGMPFLGDDPIFGIALIQLLRRFSATAVMVLGESETEEDNSFTKLMLDHADCVIRFRQRHFFGAAHHVVDVQKTRSMGHRRDAWELVTDISGPRVANTLALLRFDPLGNVKPVQIALHLHSDTPSHTAYNGRILSAVQAALSHEARLEQQERSYDPNILPLVSASAIDELQVLQLDEFQLPRADSSASSKLREFSTMKFGDLIADRLPDLSKQVVRNGFQGFIAVPFYTNLGLLVYRNESFRGRKFPSSWEALAEHCSEWQEAHPGELFFACHAIPVNHFESYNCLFFEILYTLSDSPTIVNRPASGEAGLSCGLSNLLASPTARKAARIFWTLTHHSHALTLKAWKQGNDIDIRTYAKAHVWRHWFSTLTQMLELDGGVSPGDISVVPLYGRRPGEYMTTAGEWYLGVPMHSAAQEVGIEIIRFLTTPEHEIQRLNLGVGLPTRKDYYSISETDAPTASVSKYFDLHPALAGRLIDSAFRRSDFGCYQLFTETISTHLGKLLEVTDPAIVDAQIESTMENLHSGIDYIGRHDVGHHCARCRSSGSTLWNPAGESSV